MDIKQFAIPPEQLKCECDPNIFNFNCTQVLAALKKFIAGPGNQGNRIWPEYG
jgi:hypothetical protein